MSVVRLQWWSSRGRDQLALLPLHRFGWWVLGVGLLAVLAGWSTRWFELRVVGLFCLLLVLSAMAFVLGRPEYGVELRLDEARARVGEPAGGSISVRNLGRRRALPARIDLPVGDLLVGLRIPSLGPGAQFQGGFEVPTGRRAVVRVGPAAGVQGDPLGLAGRVRPWTGIEQLYVHPRTIALPGRQAGFVHDLEGCASQVLTAADMDFHTLREYAPGDDRRQVHWRSSARAGQLLVRQFSESRQSRLALLLDTHGPSYLAEEDFELAVAAAASIGVQALREDHRLTLLYSQRVLPMPQPRRLLDEMAGVGTGGMPTGELLREALRRVPTSSLVVLVTGALPTGSELTRLLSVVAGDVRVVAVSCDPEAATRVRSVGRRSLVRVPNLDELPRAMRRAMP